MHKLFSPEGLREPRDRTPTLDLKQTNNRSSIYSPYDIHLTASSFLLLHQLQLYDISRIEAELPPPRRLCFVQNPGVYAPNSLGPFSGVRNGSRPHNTNILHLMDHASSLPDGPPMASREPARNVYPAGAQTPTARHLMTSPRPDETPNPQTRLLQLRNAGFRGPVIAGRRVSPIFSSPCSLPDSFGYPINDENASRTAEKRMLYGEDLPPSPANILQEIHNSTRRKRHSPKLGLGEIFQDTAADENNTLGSPAGTSWYTPGHTNCSSSPSNAVRSKMAKRRQNSWTVKSPPALSPPLGKHVKSRKVNRTNARSTSFESATYIEHLESQLAAVNAKLDSMMSPTTNKARAVKLRALSNESRSLRQEVSNWETSFEERVRDQLERRAEVEKGMSSHIERLEEEMEVKDARLKELEWELDSMTNKIREMEGLEEINLNLERRIDVLTSLVAQSPTKLNLCSAASSPTKEDPFSRARRRRSMLPRVPSSPGGVRLSLNTATDNGFWSSRRFGSNSSTLASPEGTNRLIEEEEGADKTMEPLPRETHSSSFSNTSASYPSAPFSFTRPPSTHSASSIDLSSPELPFPLDVDYQIKSVNRQRRMRRFPSGLCTLKPLLLPKATVTASLPASAPVSATSGLSPRHISNVSLDPTVAFLSKIDDGSRNSTPTQGLRQRSATWAQEDTLRTLEGNPKAFSFIDDGAIAYSPTSPGDILLDRNGAVAMEQAKPRRARPLSLEKELELANMLSPNNFDDALIAVDAEEDGMLESIPIGMERSPQTPLMSQNLLPPQSPSEADITPRPRPCASLLPSPPPSISLPTLAKGTALGIFTRLTNLINRVKQDPVVLAKRLLCNAWTLGSARLGGAGWWLLGLLFRSHRREKTSRADRKTVEDNATGNFNWNHLSANASRRRTAERYVSDRSGGISSNEQKRRGSCSSGPLEASPSESSRAHLSRREPHVFPCDACIEPSARRTFRLWFHFSLAMVLAVGMAIKHGPGTLLMDHNAHTSHVHPGSEPEGSESSTRSDSAEADVTTPRTSAPAGAETEDESKDGVGGYRVAFAPILGPAHFGGV